MLSYTTIDLRGGWPTLPKTAQLAPGASGPDVVTLRQRLIMTDDLAPDRDKGDSFDATLDGGGEALSGSPRTDRNRQRRPENARCRSTCRSRIGCSNLRATLDRISELNFQFGQRYVVVNIPATVAEAVDGDVVQKRYVVVVGKVDRQVADAHHHRSTPSISTRPGRCRCRIIKKDIMTRMRRDPGYVSAHAHARA